jgi:hypothetical protein
MWSVPLAELFATSRPPSAFHEIGETQRRPILGFGLRPSSAPALNLVAAGAPHDGPDTGPNTAPPMRDGVSTCDRGAYSRVFPALGNFLLARPYPKSLLTLAVVRFFLIFRCTRRAHANI